MLFVGIVDDLAGGIADRFAQHGAVVGRVEAPPAWDPSDPSIVALTCAGRAGAVPWAGLQLAVAKTGETCADVVIGGTAQLDALWLERLIPFEANLRLGRRAPRQQTPSLVESDSTWPQQAERLIERLRFCVGERVLRLDHIGSTSVPGLPAKQLLDIQVVVSNLSVAGEVAQTARRAGFVHVAGCWFGTDRHGVDHPEEVVVDADPCRPVNVNIRSVEEPIWRETLLFRDWLRRHDHERDKYAAMKNALAADPDANVDAYSEEKMPWISAALRRAEVWASATGWSP